MSTTYVSHLLCDSIYKRVLPPSMVDVYHHPFLLTHSSPIGLDLSFHVSSWLLLSSDLVSTSIHFNTSCGLNAVPSQGHTSAIWVSPQIQQFEMLNSLLIRSTRSKNRLFPLEIISFSSIFTTPFNYFSLIWSLPCTPWCQTSLPTFLSKHIHFSFIGHSPSNFCLKFPVFLDNQ